MIHHAHFSGLRCSSLKDRMKSVAIDSVGFVIADAAIAVDVSTL